ncbi:hypothetical protein T552_00564 [Pneumocystis carinii B80]|uniref:Uncharacterized protein n=1 Tax=Pneumocystis carinii (strain B80) TaxID=1408658 RepID=A0A0W4ZR46_PNEC8|nr:hypothetical protein T552_00564 [Pneumocystis carinii B80]KTW30853.1 hypothetical protein T552_00564 [Pneumocystis carinii B80]
MLNKSAFIDSSIKYDKNMKKGFEFSNNVNCELPECYNNDELLSDYISLRRTSSCQALPSSPSCDIKIRLAELTTYIPSRKYKLFRKIIRLIRQKNIISTCKNYISHFYFYILEFIQQTLSFCFVFKKNQGLEESENYKRFKEEECYRRAFLQEILILTFFKQFSVKQEQIKDDESNPSNIIKNGDRFVIKPSTSTCPITPQLQSSSSTIASVSQTSTDYALHAFELSPPFYNINQLSPGDFQSSPDKSSIVYTGDEKLSPNISLSPGNCKLHLHDTYVGNSFLSKRTKNGNWNIMIL